MNNIAQNAKDVMPILKKSQKIRRWSRPDVQDFQSQKTSGEVQKPGGVPLPPGDNFKRHKEHKEELFFSFVPFVPLWFKFKSLNRYQSSCLRSFYA
ncbi:MULTISPECIES: hypothetical protein [Gammaproteobacteria]|uniref:hypothetical protein n=1 Tax=Gammaproteobacteria TaxID=1236 RepID=UPI001ADD403E|nr:MULTISPECIES: hypothetical protein [Gammaproteobacteria]MBO9484698.1 hypothetical protein [Salinisphaera sp. G21_0]MBO9496648.1 hypothetical protein [Thalassotalea sp. G20_0]